LNRFVREARITARLEHPNIVPVYDIGIDLSGSPFFTMKYLRGATLAVVLKRLRSKDAETMENFPQTRLIQFFVRICNAVAFAHSMNVCHFDLKPGNIHCGDFGEVQVIDWGLAGDISAGAAGQIKGTPGYMAPELINGNYPPGKAADIYALGCILYAILTLDSPLAGLPQQEVLRRTASGRIPPPSLEGTQLPPALEAICQKAMAFDPAERYQSAWDLRSDLNAALAGYATAAEEASAMRNIFLFLRRNIYSVIIVMLLVLSGILSLLVWYLYTN
jgi:serine/threonine protein kinase